MHLETSDYYDLIIRAQRARVLSDLDAIAMQQLALPRCTAHGKPAAANDGTNTLCLECIQERLKERRNAQH